VVRDVVAATLDRHGRVDGLVNNAGASTQGPIAGIDLAEYRRIFDLNMASLIGVTQAVLRPCGNSGSVGS
jgi:NADP-dependent 3-hydroxy acid dehydrogenase YdfG